MIQQICLLNSCDRDTQDISQLNNKLREGMGNIGLRVIQLKIFISFS